jgi:hypothetical protein
MMRLTGDAHLPKKLYNLSIELGYDSIHTWI